MKKKLLLTAIALALLLTSCGQPAASPTPMETPITTPIDWRISTKLTQMMDIVKDDLDLPVGSVVVVLPGWPMRHQTTPERFPAQMGFFSRRYEDDSLPRYSLTRHSLPLTLTS